MNPVIYHPITNKLINLYSNEINELLTQGYSEEDLLARRSLLSNTLTGLADADYNILINMKYDQLMTLCQTNKYTYKLCENKQFWINKVNYDNLPVPDKSLFNDISGMKIYYLCYTIDHYINKTSTTFYVNVENIGYLIKQYIPDYEEKLGLRLDNIRFNKIHIDKYKTEFAIAFTGHDYEGETIFDRQTTINFLFDGLKNNILSHKRYV